MGSYEDHFAYFELEHVISAEHYSTLPERSLEKGVDEEAGLSFGHYATKLPQAHRHWSAARECQSERQGWRI